MMIRLTDQLEIVREEKVIPDNNFHERVFHGSAAFRRPDMYIEKQIDDLIETGLSCIDARFDPVAFQQWRKRCVSCLSVLLGSDHICTRFFRRHLQGASRNNFVVGVGILAVVNHESKKTYCDVSDRKSGPSPVIACRVDHSVARKV